MHLVTLLTPKPTPRVIKLPLLLSHISAGFPSPADDFIEDALDLQALLVRHPAATCLSYAEDDGLIHLGIFQNDLLIIDSSLKSTHLSLVLAELNGEFITRQLDQHKGVLIAHPSKAILNVSATNAVIHGVVTYSIRSHYEKISGVSDDTFDLTTLLIKNTVATFLARTDGDSMIGAGIFDNDLLIIDRSIKACHGKLVVAAINGEFLVKRFDQANGLLISENPAYPPFDVNNNPSLFIEGVITFSIRSHFWH